MIVLEYKVRVNKTQTQAIDEAIRTGQFIQNKCLRLWMEQPGLSRYDLNRYCKVLAEQYPFAKALNSMARQASAERTWCAISRFYQNCRQNKPGKKGYPKFKKQSNDLVTYENLNVKGLVKNRHLAKSISDAGWYQFRCWLEYFGWKYGKVTVAVAPHNTSQNCSRCGKKVQKSL